MHEALTYDDVLLVPQYSDIESRSEIDISNQLDKKITLNVPIISSPMDTVTEDEMAVVVAEQGGLGIIHRYNRVKHQCHQVETALKDPACHQIGAAVGVTGDYLERVAALVELGVDVLCVDVAHGHHKLVERAIGEIKSRHEVHVMAGNVATAPGYKALVEWGADSIRCNIGGGSICSTRVQTGHGVPGLQTIFECAAEGLDVPIIADGGIRNSGDIVKAIAAGADFVMLGSLLAGTRESPGVLYTRDGADFKVYRGMASRDAQKDWRGRMTSAPEGVSTSVPYKGPTKEVMQDLAMGIRSGFSYTGARTMSEFQSKAKFLKQTGASQVESSAHILRGGR